jgi:uncharacterized membrane protein YdbT with pleckstrin-like domain
MSEIVREGRPSKAAAVAVAAVGIVVFGGLTALVFSMDPVAMRPVHYVLGTIAACLAGIMLPWQLLDATSRKHTITTDSLIYRCGILSTFEVEIPFTSIQAITVKQGIIQRLFGCGDVRVAAPGVSGPVLISSRDRNTVCLRSIPDYREVSDLLRKRLTMVPGVTK